MSGFLSRSVLLAIYGGALAVGLALIAAAVISLLRSFTPGSQPAAEGQSRRLNRGAIYAVGLGVAVLGGAGLGALLLRLSPELSTVTALGAGLLVGLVAALLLIYVPNRRRREETGLAIEADGREARVVIAIPASGLGEVAYDDGAETVHLGARSATGRTIAADSQVRIERLAGRVAVVRPISANGAAGSRR